MVAILPAIGNCAAASISPGVISGFTMRSRQDCSVRSLYSLKFLGAAFSTQSIRE
jgi:hypothetical protein